MKSWRESYIHEKWNSNIEIDIMKKIRLERSSGSTYWIANTEITNKRLQCLQRPLKDWEGRFWGRIGWSRNSHLGAGGPCGDVEQSLMIWLAVAARRGLLLAPSGQCTGQPPTRRALLGPKCQYAKVEKPCMKAKPFPKKDFTKVLKVRGEKIWQREVKFPRYRGLRGWS